MFLKKIRRLKGTLALRLTFWYTGIFSLSTLIAFFAFFLMISAFVDEQRDKHLLVELKEFSIMLSNGGLDEVTSGMLWESSSDGVGNIFLRLFSKNGEMIAATDLSEWQEVVQASHSVEQLKASTAGDYVFETLSMANQRHQARIVSGYIGNDFILQYGLSLASDEQFLEIFENVFIPIMIAVTGIAALTGWFMGKRALAGVEEVTRTARHISSGAFERRVSVKAKGREIEQLATAFNCMLDRIDTLFKEMKEMSNNIAHDLRSPLARMRGAAEMALTTATTVDESKAMAAGVIEDCDHLLGLINTMLDIAEAESGVAELKLGTVDIAQLITSACDLLMPVAEDKSVRLITQCPADCTVCGDPRMLQRMVGNLLDNALKYTPSQGTVTVSVAAETEQVLLTVRDSGLGISDKDLPNIFKKFYRCDYSRAQHGNGLGLSLVKAIAGSHGGRVTATSRLGEGSVFTVMLPRSSDAC